MNVDIHFFLWYVTGEHSRALTLIDDNYIEPFKRSMFCLKLVTTHMLSVNAALRNLVIIY